MIATAVSQGLSGVVIDERKGRRVAGLVYHLKVKGTAGLLLVAKQRGLITEIRPIIEGMKAKGYFLSSRLMQELQEEALRFVDFLLTRQAENAESRQWARFSAEQLVDQYCPEDAIYDRD